MGKMKCLRCGYETRNILEAKKHLKEKHGIKKSIFTIIYRLIKIKF